MEVCIKSQAIKGLSVQKTTACFEIYCGFYLQGIDVDY